MGNSNSKNRQNSNNRGGVSVVQGNSHTGQVDAAAQLAAARLCHICMEAAPHAITCTAGHHVCTECFSNYVEMTWAANVEGKIANMQNGELPEVRCVEPGCRARPFSTTEVIRHTNDSAAKAFLDIIQRTKDGQTYANAQKILAEATNSNNSNAGVKEAALLQEQLKSQLGNAKQCPKCHFGPVEQLGCNDLSGYGAKNRCPNCGFYSSKGSDWDRWDGTVSDGITAQVGGKKPPSPPQRTRASTTAAGVPQGPPSAAALRPRAATTSGQKTVSFSTPTSGGFTPTLANLGTTYSHDIQLMERRLIRFYRVYAPERLVKVPELVEKYRVVGPDPLFSALIAKYGPEPNDALPPASYSGQTAQQQQHIDPFLEELLAQNATGPAGGSFAGSPRSANNLSSVAGPLSGGVSLASPTSLAPPPYPNKQQHQQQQLGGSTNTASLNGSFSSSFGPNAAVPPRKYKKGTDGIRRINPDYLAYHARKNPNEAQPGTIAGEAVTSTSVLHPNTALAVCSSMDEYGTMFSDAPLAPITDNAIEMMQEQPAIPQRVGLHVDTMTDTLGKTLAKYEAPIGMMPKLLELRNFNLIEFIIDDSGSMNLDSDVRASRGGPFLTRWEEVKARLETMFELLSCVPTPMISVVFLNRRDQIQLRSNGAQQSPESFLSHARRELERIWAHEPEGRTPAMQAIERSFHGRERLAVVRYFFGDGEPNGGRREEQQIGNFLKTRPVPARNPFTFMSCTDNDEQVEWMRDVEEIAPYCAEYDDFANEAREVARDHGGALPYSLGMHLVGQLVGAMNPDDLDALDESVPLTKGTLDNMLGYQHSEAEYRHYFNNFISAQAARVIKTPADRVRKEVKWGPALADFLKARTPGDIGLVRNYRLQLQRMAL